ncbi:acetyl-CoA carboxylase biotin carboxyl carrier protein [Radiobacillus kanasensis]|uniref:acetyl-CoA carboxylase biotin carboxyl carrier protein n=1 Tax=Radiobacillus kanasensis TaxID=2844358 RepID=UPI001E2911E9|nr:acetyl-CoA carboxylase biotin carboxyl carrier protein [Radiobacillus kanasensis]UFT97734.1 acetyl-CoA carboxylase biotin carboxyl carrier protein [Radiobacillus kanasensis]
MLNVKEIQELIHLIDHSSIDEFTYETNEAKVSLKKNSQPTQTVVTEPVVHNVATPQPVASAVEQQPASQAVATEESGQAKVDFDHEIVSPMVGTFYSSPNPESDVFVKKGDKVSSDTVVCIVEAMKLFNEIEAEVSGEIVEILVGNGELVEYGQPLFRVKG